MTSFLPIVQKREKIQLNFFFLMALLMFLVQNFMASLLVETVDRVNLITRQIKN